MESTLHSLAMELVVAPIMESDIFRRAEEKGISKNEIINLSNKMQNDLKTRLNLAQEFLEKIESIKNKYEFEMSKIVQETAKFKIIAKDLSQIEKLLKKHRNNQLSSEILEKELNDILINKINSQKKKKKTKLKEY